MKTKQIGSTDLRMPPIAFGCNVLGWTMNEKESFKLLDAVYDMGFNYMDTADVYSRWVDGHEGGESERILGKWIKERGLRDRLIVATKVGMDVGQGHIDLSRDHINKQIDKSLKNLQTDYVDVYFSHRHDNNTPIDEVLHTYADLIKAGKVRHVGASSFPLDVFKQAIQSAQDNGLPKYQIYQPEYSLVRREDFENGYQQYVQEHNISVTNYWALANGFLTGKYESVEDVKGSSREDNLKKYFDDNGQQVLDALKKVSDESGISQAGVTIAWTMAQDGITAPIVSATKIEQLKAFKEASSTTLDKEHLELLTKVSHS